MCIPKLNPIVFKMTTKSPDILLIDVNGLGYSAMYQPNLAKLQHNGQNTAALHGAMASIFSRLAEYPNALPLVVWDGRAAWRKELLPEYKENRSDTPEKVAIREAYRQQVPYIQLMLMYLGIPQIRSGSAEADDLAGVICRALCEEYLIEMVSRDTDWWQGLHDNVWWYSPLSKKAITLEDFMNPEVGTNDGHFLSTDEYLQCKALAGDTSDCIPGVPKVGLKTAAKYIRQYGTIEELWRRADAKEEKIKGTTLENLIKPETRELYARNLQLMDWRNGPAIDTATLAAFWLQPDILSFEKVCAEYGLSRVSSSAKKFSKLNSSWQKRWSAVVNALGI